MKLSTIVWVVVLWYLWQSGILGSLWSSVTGGMASGSGAIPIASAPVAGNNVVPGSWYVAPSCNSVTPGTCPSGTVIGGVLVKP